MSSMACCHASLTASHRYLGAEFTMHCAPRPCVIEWIILTIQHTYTDQPRTPTHTHNPCRLHGRTFCPNTHSHSDMLPGTPNNMGMSCKLSSPDARTSRSPFFFRYTVWWNSGCNPFSLTLGELPGKNRGFNHHEDLPRPCKSS